MTTKYVLKKIALYVTCAAGAICLFLSPGTGTIGFIISVFMILALGWNILADREAAKEAKAAKAEAEKAEAERLEAERRKPLTEAEAALTSAEAALDIANQRYSNAVTKLLLASTDAEKELAKAELAAAVAERSASEEAKRKAVEKVAEAKAALGEA